MSNYKQLTKTARLYQFMEPSKLPTMYFQKSLPRLPIPLLEKTCQRFLDSTAPILSAEEQNRTKEIATEFRKGVGMELHALLKEKDASNKHTSYISEPWFDMYLSDRAPLPLNYNPVIVMKNDIRPEYQNQIIRAANLVVSSLRFWRSLQANLLEPEVFHLNAKKSDTAQFRQWMKLAPTKIATYVAYTFKAFPLDMSQYNRLFGVSRIPELHKDRLVQNSESKHIIVMRRGNMYSVNVLDDNRNIESPSVILGRLKAVIELDEKRGPAEVPLGVLTAGERDNWARTRKHLIDSISQKNKHLLEQEVDGALFFLCLDTDMDPVFDEQDLNPLLKNLLAGVGYNRWFDKSVSLLICADGTAAVNFEHSWGDGVAVLRYFNEIYKETTENPFVHPHTSSSVINNSENVRELSFDIDQKLKEEVSLAQKKNIDIMNNLNMHILRYKHLNKILCKQYGVSPDSIMQLSFQLAYRQIFNNYVGTYESCSTAAFRHGRTETMRPCTMATKAFCEAILQSATKTNPKDLSVLLQTCSTVHGQLTKDAAMGQGFDRHLFALKQIAIANKLSIPKLYNTEAYRKINTNLISTSTLSSDALFAGCFGPVEQKGLGIGYGIQNDECGAIITSYQNQCNGKDFAASLEDAFKTIYNILNRKEN